MKATMEIRIKVVVFYNKGIRSAKENRETYNLSKSQFIIELNSTVNTIICANRRFLAE
jgi:hypothetical protein